ncbi:MAG: HAD family phosphatase [Firmicutes bacterium]|nr:HAD family phosphatase [Bacillota bacterium]
MHKPIGIIALDLDGTLLNSEKELSPGNLAALQRAADAGWEIVPTTGRFYGGMPEVIRQLPFVHYAITINGACVEDLADGRVLYSAEIPKDQAIRIMEYMDTLPVIYDCYMSSAAWMTEALKAKVDEVVEDPRIRKMFYELRQPVPELKAFIAEGGQDVQKTQFFATDMTLRARLLEEMPKMFENIVATSSSPQNVEINNIHANKGEALLALADAIGVSREKVLAFGDGLNDVTMIKAAGVGIAMENAEAVVKEAADWVTKSCDEDGVAAGIEKYCLKLFAL